MDTGRLARLHARNRRHSRRGDAPRRAVESPEHMWERCRTKPSTHPLRNSSAEIAYLGCLGAIDVIWRVAWWMGGCRTDAWTDAEGGCDRVIPHTPSLPQYPSYCKRMRHAEHAAASGIPAPAPNATGPRRVVLVMTAALLQKHRSHSSERFQGTA